MSSLRRLSVLVVAIACASPSDNRQQVVDSAGVRVASYSASATPPSTWQLAADPLLQLGGDDDPATIFSAIRGVARLSDGGVAVAVGGSNEIRIYSRDGAFVRAVGRTGSGPGEFKRLTRLLRIGDTLVGVDGDSRAHVFDPAGVLVRSLRPARRAESRNPRRLGVGEAGSSYVLVIDGAPQAEAEGQVIMQTLTRSDAAGDSLLPIVTFPGYRTHPINGTPARLLLDGEAVTATAMGGVCVGYSDRFEISCYDPTGRITRRVSRDLARREVTEADRQIVRQAYLAANTDAPPPVRQQMERMVLALPFATTAPALSRMMLRDDGELWVSPFQVGVGLPGPAASLAPTAAQTWNVFAPDGRWIANVSLPPRFEPYEIGSDYVAGVQFDDDDVERVVVWRLVK